MHNPVGTDQITTQVAAALAEDIGPSDLTANLLPIKAQATAQVIAREPAILCGTDWFTAVFQQLAPSIVCTWSYTDGDWLVPQQPVCTVHGPARALLSGERTALNFLQSLSGTASTTAQYVRAVHGTKVQIRDTRKTLPGLRLAQKYAVTCGGGTNQRLGLYDAILIKENHIQAAGSIAQALAAAQSLAAAVPIQIEVESLAELTEALTAGATSILLDNFSPALLQQAVAINQGRACLEASGGISLATVRTIAETGVDAISIGRITKDLQAIDFSMRFISSN